MEELHVDAVVDFYNDLFAKTFISPLSTIELDRLKRNAVIRQIQEAADAASPSLIRLFTNQQIDGAHVSEILLSLAETSRVISGDDLANPNVTPESLAIRMLDRIHPPACVGALDLQALFRVALHSVIQVLKLVGPVLAEWRKLGFSSTFELPSRVIAKLNQISDQLDAAAKGGTAADDRFELTYRDYLLQRFHRVDAGTVRLTTNLDVDLRELFVMPKVIPLPSPSGEQPRVAELMDLEEARRYVAQDSSGRPRVQGLPKPVSLLEQVRKNRRTVVVGPPGGGKSTFFEWLQVKLASAEEELVLGMRQAIPILLRVRQLDMAALPTGAAIIAKATASTDRATLMPDEWVHRQMSAGRVLFMLDGLDETAPDLRDARLLPWLRQIVSDYPQCTYLVSSRPVGYAPDTLEFLQFDEVELLDFADEDISTYTSHWCTSVRLARNEVESEARTEGEKDGARIVDSFTEHPHIRSLARRPLMLSAICLVNYFEGGNLPQDRAVLYRLCVEGLLHHWDQRRGITSSFSLDQKLRLCRETALQMQSEDRAEYPEAEVREVFARTLNNQQQGGALLEHVKYRTGLLLERRVGVFAFAHLTFQEYLAACAVYEGNIGQITIERLLAEAEEPKWQEVLPLYCGIAPASHARPVIDRLCASVSRRNARVLADAFRTSRLELREDRAVESAVVEALAAVSGLEGADGRYYGEFFDGFDLELVALAANRAVGSSQEPEISNAHRWLSTHPDALDMPRLLQALSAWRTKNSYQRAELIHLAIRYGVAADIEGSVPDLDVLLSEPGPKFSPATTYFNIALVAFIALASRESLLDWHLQEKIVNGALQALTKEPRFTVGLLQTPLRLLREQWIRHSFVPPKAFAQEASQMCLAVLNRTNSKVSALERAEVYSFERYLSRALGGKPTRSRKRR